MMSLSEIPVLNYFMSLYSSCSPPLCFSPVCPRLLTSRCLCPCAFSERACSPQIWRLKPSWKSRSLSWKSPVWNVSIWSFRSSSTRSGSAPTRYCSTPAWPQGGFLWGGHTAPDTNRRCFSWKARWVSQRLNGRLRVGRRVTPSALRLPRAQALLSCVGVLWRSCEVKMNGERLSLWSSVVWKGRAASPRGTWVWGFLGLFTPSLKFLWRFFRRDFTNKKLFFCS